MSFVNEFMRNMKFYQEYLKYVKPIEKQMTPKEYGIAIQGKRKKRKRK